MTGPSDISFVKADLASLKKMLLLFGEAFGEPETYQARIPADEYFISLLESDTFLPLAATIDDEVVGALVAYVLKKFERERSEIYIYDLAVSEDYRRRGIATGLINALRGIARELGVWAIFVQADRVDEPAIKLYESLGTRQDVYHFDIVP